MKKIFLWLFVSFGLLVGPLAFSQTMVAEGVIKGINGKDLGSVSIEETVNGLIVYAKANNIPAGVHGFHIHTVGSCDPETEFTSADGHLTGGKKHGFRVKGGFHSGDMPNVYVGVDKVLEAEFFLPKTKIKQYLDDDGAALMIHAGADDYMSQPSGAAGSRIACGVLLSTNK